MTTARRLLFRLFLEGVEVPVVGARISSAAGAPSAAIIQVVPTDRALDFHPRTMVHLFSLDITNPSLDGELVPVEGVRRNSLAVLKNYKLCFHGVSVGFRVLKEGARRQTFLQCVGPSSSWDNVHQYSMAYGPRGSAWGNTYTEEGEAVLFDDITGNPAEAAAKFLQDTPEYGGFRDVEEGVLAGVLSFLEAVGGVPDAFKGVNDFTTVEELRLHVLDQIAYIPQDESALKLFDRGAFKKWLKNQLGRMGALASVRDIVNLVLAYIYHSVSTNPAPKYEPGGEDYTTEETVSVSNLSSEAQDLVEALIETLEDLDKQTTEATTQLRGGGSGASTGPSGYREGAFGQSDTSEYGGQVKVLFPASAHNAFLGLEPIKQYVISGPTGAHVDSEHSYVTYPHAVYPTFLFHGEYIAKLGTSCERVKRVVRRALFPLVSNAGTDVVENLESCIAELGKAANYTPTTEVRTVEETEEYVPDWMLSSSGGMAPVAAGTGTEVTETVETVHGTSLGAMQEYIRQAIDHLRSANGTHPETVTHNHVTMPKLKTLIVHPDTWFVAPPRCNVLFPEQYTRFELSRGHMQEISRYQIRSGLEKKGKDTLEWYYSAPNLLDYLEKEDEFFKQSPAILPHEEYTGIIAKMHSMEELALYLTDAQKAQALEAAGEGKDRVAFTQRVAHFNFYTHRFAPRTARVSALFNYHLVCGFPLLLIDKPFLTPYGMNTSDLLWDIQHSAAQAVVAEALIPWGGLPNQFLGQISSLDHNIDQNGGGTVLHLTHVRTHRTAYGTDDEFLNARLASEDQPLESVKAMAVVLNFDQLMAAGNKTALTVLRDCTPNPSLLGGGTIPENIPVPVQYAGPEEGNNALGIPADSAIATEAEIEAGTEDDCSIAIGAPAGQWKGLMSATEVRNLEFNDAATVKYLRSNGIIRREEVDGQLWNFYDSVTLIIEGFVKADATVRTAVPVEEAIRPDWVGEVYGNDQIGEEVYQNFFGTGSVVDEQIFLVNRIATEAALAEEVAAETEPTADVDEDAGYVPRGGLFASQNEADAGGTEVQTTYTGDQYAENYEEFGAVSNTRPDGGPITDVAAVQRDADGILSNVVAVELDSDVPRVTSVASAVDSLAVIYGAAIRNNLDVHRFVWEYGYRPVATLVDIFGDPAYQLDETGRALSQKEIDDEAIAGLSPARTAAEVLTDWSQHGKGYVSPALEDADKLMLQERWARIRAGSVGAFETLGDLDVVPPLDAGGEMTSTASVAPATSVDDAPAVDDGLGPAPETVDAWEEEAEEVAELEAEIAGAQADAPDENEEYPQEGFHGRALADLSGLVGLITDETGAPIDIASKSYHRRDGLGEKEPITPAVDHRKERKERVLEYLAGLKLRGIRG